jgi:cytochrome c-type biogenesis protein CcsB
MTNAQWETLSNQAVAASGVLYFLALLAYLVQWSALRRVPTGVNARASETSVGSMGPRAGDGSVDVALGPPEPDDDARAALSGHLGLVLTIFATTIHAGALAARGMAADPNRVPWGNMYEFTLAGTFFVSLIFLLAYRRLALEWMAPIVVGLVLTVEMVAVIWLYGPVTPLTEALNSPWLVIHVVSAIIATAAFTLGGIASALYLWKERSLGKKRSVSESGYLARVPDLRTLDVVSYRLHAFAFPVWTFAVLITGPIWAHQAWSTYWNWDPKEVWAFITWVIYAAYLHARATAGWRGRNAAYLALIGVATLWFNFIGINYFSTSTQHGYAAPAASSNAPAKV